MEAQRGGQLSTAQDHTMTLHFRLRGIVAALAMLAASSAGASGDDPQDSFVNRSGTDVKLQRYQNGALGVVLPTYERAYLYTAWRGVVLGRAGLKTAPNPEGGLEHLLALRRGGWTDTAGREVYIAWRDATAVALKRDTAPPKNKDMVLYTYINCPIGSYSFAIGTLTALAKRADATPARLADWVSAQRQVFKACGDDPQAQPVPFGQPRPAVAAPAAAPSNEALYWRQMREYQQAAAAFYSEDYALSGALFTKIGATDKHPLRQWGAYLSLRSQARAALFIPGPPEARWKAQQDAAAAGPAAVALRLADQQKKMAAIQASVDRIVADPSLEAVHEDSRVIGRSMLARLTPETQFDRLGKLLDDPRADPYVDDHLGDWAVLADQLLQPSPPGKPDTRPALRASAGFIDWMESVNCNDTGTAPNCATERAHAVEQWSRYVKSGNAAQARVWLMAAAMLSKTMSADLEKASLQVAPDAPEYATLQLALARHYRLGQQAAKARAISDAALANRDSISARNLFLQERFAVAATPAEAAGYLMRAQSNRYDTDTGEQAKATTKPATLAADGRRWLNSGLAAADLLALGADTRLPQPVRARIGVAAWMRFDLLGQEADAIKAAQQIEQTSQVLAPLMRQYRALSDARERRHWMLLNAARYNLTPMAGAFWATEITLQPPEETTAGMWCKMPAKAGGSYAEDVEPEQVPAMPQTGDAALRDKELARLAALKTATGFLGEHVIQRVATTPKDPDLPWLLHVVVQSTRGGCLDDDAKSLSKRAFNLLHKRYGGTEWAKKTPYFY
jgi:ketosteroid isomerase-like protein